jgi:hypothetical protein
MTSISLAGQALEIFSYSDTAGEAAWDLGVVTFCPALNCLLDEALPSGSYCASTVALPYVICGLRMSLRPVLLTTLIAFGCCCCSDSNNIQVCCTVMHGNRSRLKHPGSSRRQENNVH